MRVAIALVALVVTAGCLGGADTNPKNDPRPDPPAPPSTPPSATPEPGVVVLASGFSYVGCNGIDVRVELDPSAAQGLLPANYTAVTNQGTASNNALARYRVFACDQFLFGNGAINATVYGDVAIMIDDPDIHASGDVHWYRLAIFTAEDNLQAAWEQAGYDIVAGEVTRAQGPPATLDFEGYAASWLSGFATSDAARHVMFTDSPQGVIVWEETLEDAAPQRVAGTFSVPASDPLSGMWQDLPDRVRIIVRDGLDVTDATAVWFRV